MQDHRQMPCWQKAAELALKVYQESRSFPRDERFGLTRQIREAAVSIASNIAEGRGRMRDTELARFLEIALGSALEVQSHLFIATRMNFLAADRAATLDREIDEVKRMIYCFHRRVRADLRDA